MEQSMKLLPCPFCGGKAKLGKAHWPHHYVFCLSCGARVVGTGYGEESEIDACKRWNRREEGGESTSKFSEESYRHMYKELVKQLVWAKDTLQGHVQALRECEEAGLISHEKSENVRIGLIYAEDGIWEALGLKERMEEWYARECGQREDDEDE